MSFSMPTALSNLNNVNAVLASDLFIFFLKKYSYCSSYNVLSSIPFLFYPYALILSLLPPRHLLLNFYFNFILNSNLVLYIIYNYLNTKNNFKGKREQRERLSDSVSPTISLSLRMLLKLKRDIVWPG